jgi:hypothetical protein
MGKRIPRGVTRDALLFGVGLGLTTYEALARQGERPYLLALYAGMMGLPVFTARRPPKDDDDDQ